jgi:starvation-inducible DNA-binding protein
MTFENRDQSVHTTHNTLPERVRAQSVELLNLHLSAAIDLQGQLKHAHWNVRGTDFIGVHRLFDEIASHAASFADQLAERSAGLGGVAQGTIQLATKRSFLVPYPLDIADTTEHCFAVSATLASFGQSIHQAAGRATQFGDTDTADLFTEVSRGVDQQIWLVESHLMPAKVVPK